MAVDSSASDSDAPERLPHDDPPYEQVRHAARGQRKDYKLDRTPMARGGQAVVFRALHKSTQVPVAFKKLVADNRSAVARMRREIEASRKFGSHPHVMPVLDADTQNSWFVMPLAEATASTQADELADPDRLRELVTAVCLALREPHRLGWVHRDLKPDNILLLDGRWTVADWGLGRRPRGQTSDPRRTAAGTQFGTLGFAAPEMSVNAHEIGPQADVYSIGQIIGWALTGQWPQANIPLLPEPGPWRRIVQDATAFGNNEHRRPADAEALLTLVAAELDAPTESPIDRAKRLLADPNTAGALLGLAADVGPDRDFFNQVLLPLDEEQLRTALMTDPASAQQVLQAVRALPDEDSTGIWLLTVARIAESLAEWDVLREAAESVLRLNRPEDDVRSWLTSLTGDAASAAAAALRGYAADYQDLLGASDLDDRIAKVLRAKPRAGSVEDARGESIWWSRRRWRLVGAATITAAAAAITIPIVLNETSNPTTPSNPGATSSANEPRLPSKVAGTPQLASYVSGWDQYPTWKSCTTNNKDATVDGTFPAAAPAQALPANVTFSCDAGEDVFTVMFGEYTVRVRDYNDAVARYRSAPRAQNAVKSEASPPDGLHVFQWSATHRALMWFSQDRRTIGILTTKSPNRDLVENWQKYQR
ncbi:serine/threonine-protein kinase [Kibdelosporangium aridum]|uniref:non-specific serine/threonine protein kinase n=1 Tax=Kibdelosporangium aridum TaxID=2030 RepID=A0A1W1ZG43_KIBAR|nr:serine/threonine-protein kinase [Kibdelosporangium aridum]SMC47152.1 Protein kinase domain-containing protein [Kibdelosporangium aridum]